MSDTFGESDIETLHNGAMGAEFLASVGDPGFFDTLKEARSEETFADRKMRYWTLTTLA